MSKLELFKLLLIKYEELKDTKETWFYKEETISAMLKPSGNHYHGFIIYYRTIYQFMFHPGKTELVQATVRKNNLYIKISGINAMRAFTNPSNLALIELISTCGSTKGNIPFWKELFKK